MSFQRTPLYYRARTAIKMAICCPLLLPYLLTGDTWLIDRDLVRWRQIDHYQGLFPLLYFLSMREEFRDVYNHRMKRSNFLAFLLSRLLKRFYPGQTGLHIYTENIGPGLYIQHGFSTIIAAKRIGRNFFVNQGVTVGHKGPYSPIIGDNVAIRAGAIAVGRLTIGDGAVVGAGAVVVKDVAPGDIVVGSPAKSIYSKSTGILPYEMPKP